MLPVTRKNSVGVSQSYIKSQQQQQQQQQQRQREQFACIAVAMTDDGAVVLDAV